MTFFDPDQWLEQHKGKETEATQQADITASTTVDPDVTRTSSPASCNSDHQNQLDRATAYLSALSPAIAGQGGHNQTFDAACALIKGFNLSIADARSILQGWNLRCQPPWSDAELEHKLVDADSKPDTKTRGYLLEASGYKPPVILDRIENVLETAAQIVTENRLDVLYRNGDFHKNLIWLESIDIAEYELLKIRLSKIDGFKQKAFNDILRRCRATCGAQEGQHEGHSNNDNANGNGGNGGNNGHADDDEEEFYDFTDLGNANRLVDMTHSLIRYSPESANWLIFDDRQWVWDKTLAIEALGHKIPAKILTEIPATRDEERIAAYRKWSFATQSRERQSAMVKSARSIVPVRMKDLDTDPYLLNVQNGTIDLRSGRLLRHRPEDLLTKMAPVIYDPQATAKHWERFILEIMNGDRSLANYLRRAVGYALVGVIKQHAFFLLYGTGRNGKTTMLNTLLSILGDYSRQIDSEILVAQMNSQHPTGLTELQGRRLVVADETDDDRRFAEGRIKWLTGGNRISARKMGQDFYDFLPTHKLFFSCNHRPDIRGTDTGMWSRVKVIPFEVAFDESKPGGRKPDLDLSSKLAAETSGILNWMLQGYREWESSGMSEPDVVREAIDEYQQEMDTLGWFINERCKVGEDAVEEPGKDARIILSELYGEYGAWCQATNIGRISIRKFSSQLHDKGYHSYKSNSVVYKTGIRLKTSTEKDIEVEQASNSRPGNVPF